MSAVSPVGTIAYIIDEEAVLVRVNKGWQYIAVSTFLSSLIYIILSKKKYIYIYFTTGPVCATKKNERVNHTFNV